MSWISVIAAGAAPGAALMTYFYLKDKYDTEPIRWVIKLFVLGLLVVFPTMVLQRGLVLWQGDSLLFQAFVVAGGLEEFVKWFVVYNAVYKQRIFDEPYDGIVYAVAASLGFATLENIIFAWYLSASFGDLLLRALLPVTGHALFGVVMGYYLGKARFGPYDRRYRLLGLSVVMPMLWHGGFNYILLRFGEWWIWMIIPFMILLWLRSAWKINKANASSPHKEM